MLSLFYVERKLRWIGVLAQHFQLTSLHDWQENVVAAIMEGRNAVVVQPTGSGKSLCFQLPPFLSEGKVAVVITPTISLMVDQATSLVDTGIPATYVGSAQSDQTVPERIKAGEFKVVYVTPETFFSNDGTPSSIFNQLIQDDMICVIAIDEAHLVAAWQNFRPKYAAIEGLVRNHPQVPFMFLTATAPPPVKQMITAWAGPSAEVVTASVNRPNLQYCVTECQWKTSGSAGYTRLADMLVPMIEGKKAIVYMDFIQDVTRLVVALQGAGVEAAAFHGKKLSSSDKKVVLAKWKASEVQVIVATI